MVYPTMLRLAHLAVAAACASCLATPAAALREHRPAQPLGARRGALLGCIDADSWVQVRRQTYSSSPWELEWAATIGDLNARGAACDAMARAPAKVDAWLSGVSASASATTSPDLDAAVFSHFDVQGVDGAGRPAVLRAPIEPLAGHMRHPLGLKECVPPGHTAVDVGDLSYLMLVGLSRGDVARVYPGRHILIDAGTAAYNSSLEWLVTAYKERAIDFDEIYAWEAKPQDAREYWASVPDDVAPKLHYYNAPVVADPASHMNPLRVIRDVARPGDVVALKLDIDNDEVESQLVNQIMNDERLRSTISEMFIETHYDSKQMAPWFGRQATSHAAALAEMVRLRSLGLRLHYWP